MAFEAIIKGETNAVPTSFSLDIVSLLAANGLNTVYDQTGPWWCSLTWELTVVNGTPGSGFSMQVNWQSLGGQTRALGGVPRSLDDLVNIEVYGPNYIVRNGPGSLWTIQADLLGGTDGARINWLFAAAPWQTPQVHSF